MKKIAVLMVLILVSCLSFAGGKRGYLGVNIGQIELKSDSANKQDTRKVVVLEVVEGSGAQEAGLKSHDVIRAVNGAQVESPSELVQMLETFQAGEKVDLKIERDGNPMSVAVVLGDQPVKAERQVKRWVYVSDEKSPWIGIQMDQLDGQLAEFFQVENGVLVKSVVENSPAANAGLKAGDVIIRFGDEPIAGIKDLTHALKTKEEGEEVTLVVQRRDLQENISVVLGSAKERSADDSVFYQFKDGEISDFEFSPEILGNLNDHVIKLKHHGLINSEGVQELRQEVEKLRKELEELRKRQD